MNFTFYSEPAELEDEIVVGLGDTDEGDEYVAVISIDRRALLTAQQARWLIEQLQDALADMEASS